MAPSLAGAVSRVVAAEVHHEHATICTPGGFECQAVAAAFGPRFTLSGRRCMWADPGFADVPLVNSVDTAGAIVLVRRGRTPFIEKARLCQAAGASAVVLVNSEDSAYFCRGHVYENGEADHGQASPRSGRTALVIPFVCVTSSASLRLGAEIPCRCDRLPR